MPAIQVESIVSRNTDSSTTLTVEQETQLARARETAVAWLTVLNRSFGHTPYLLEIHNDDLDSVGHLPLCLVRSRLFGRFLVSLPYLNSAGVVTPIPRVADLLVDKAVELTHELNARHLELRHETAVESPHFNYQLDQKVHMRRDLPDDPEALWTQLKSKVRNQVRKGESYDLRIEWGRSQRHVRDFYRVFSRNMRDLGTPVYSRAFFAHILDVFDEAEFGVVYSGKEPIAGAYLHHSGPVTSVPSASSLRRHKHTNANMWMYWQLLSRAIERGAIAFDFGRSTIGGGTFRFKRQWGASPSPALWQYYTCRDSPTEMRPDNPRFRLLIEGWKRLPVWLANSIGPLIVKGIP